MGSARDPCTLALQTCIRHVCTRHATHAQLNETVFAHERWNCWGLLRGVLKFCFRMDESKNLLSALEAMLALKEKTVNTSSSLEPGPSVPPEPSTSFLSSPERKRPRETDEMTRVKKPRLEQSVTKVHSDNTFASIPIRVSRGHWYERVFSAVPKGEIREKISEELNETERSEILSQCENAALENEYRWRRTDRDAIFLLHSEDYNV